ncbi:MAG: LysR family transcriptional regulator [Eubacteriales bacterium]|nr:LysR family transcriptional regulator [Eubacteriales bacterium]
MQDFRMDTFLTVCEELNYTKAAKKLGLTQPAVSQHIRHLEKTYGTQLFGTQGKKIFLTEAGKLLHSAALTMKDDELHLRRKMADTENPVKEYHFGATLTVAEYILPDKIKNFLKNDPDCHMTITAQNTTELLREIDSGEIDFAVVEGDFPKEHYDYLLYSREPYIGVCGRDFACRTSPLCLEDLLSYTLITREKGSGTRDILESVLAEHNLKLTDFSRVVEYGSVGAIKKLVEQNCGITFLYKKAAEGELLRQTLFELPVDGFCLTHNLNFVFRKKSIFRKEYEKLFRMLK